VFVTTVTMTSQTEDCFTRLLLKKYPKMITEDTIECLVKHGFRDKEVLLEMDVESDLPILPIPMAQEILLKEILLEMKSMNQKSFKDILKESLVDHINEIDTQLANNSSATEPLAESSTPQPSPTPPTTTTAIIISSDDSDAESVHISSTRALRGTKTRALNLITNLYDKSVDTEDEDSSDGQTPTTYRFRKRVNTSHTGPPTGAQMSGHNRKKQFACDWFGCEYSTNYQGHFKAHWLRHLKQKQYKCTENGCNECYADMVSLYHHKKAVHSNVTFVCDHSGCGQAFKYRIALNNHRKRQHL
jgi:hypothetical protein